MLTEFYGGRSIAARYPGAEGAIKAYLEARWKKVTTDLANAGAPPRLLVFLNGMADRALGKEELSTKEDLPEHTRGMIETGVALFEQLSASVEPERLKEFEGNRSQAQKFAEGRKNEAKSKLFQLLAKVADPGLHQRLGSQKKDKGQTGRAKASKKEGSELDPQAELNKAVNRAMLLFRRDKRVLQSLGSPPSPFKVHQALEVFNARGSLEVSSDDLDQLVARVIRSLEAERLQTYRPFVGIGASSSEALQPWSWRFPATQQETELAAWFDDAPLSGVQHLSQTREFQYSKPTGILEKAQSWIGSEPEWLADARGYLKEINKESALIENLSNCQGVTGEVGNRMRSLLSTMTQLVHEAKGRKKKESARAAARFEDAYQKYNNFRSLLPKGSWWSKKGLALWEKLPSLLEKGCKAQEPVREFLQTIFRDYPEQTRVLAGYLEPRLRWFEERNPMLATTSEELRNLDPLLPIMDAQWMPRLAAELLRVQQVAERIDAVLQKVPADFPSREDLLRERAEIGDLTGALLKEASQRLYEKLSGEEPPSSLRPKVAAISSWELPVLSRYPRLQAFVEGAHLFKADLETQVAIDDMLESAPNRAYDSQKAEHQDLERIAQGRADFAFWCRTFNAHSDPEDFLAEFLGWHSAHHDALSPYASVVGQDEDGPQGLFSSLLKRVHGRHPVAEPSAEVQKEQAQELMVLKRRVGTSTEAWQDLQGWLNTGEQPESILALAATFVAAAATAGDGSNREAARNTLRGWLALASPELRHSARTALLKIDDLKLADWVEGVVQGAESQVGPMERAMTVLDLPQLKLSEDQRFRLALEAAKQSEPIVRAAGASVLAELVHSDQAEATIKVALPGLDDPEPGIAALFEQVLGKLVDANNREVAEAVVGFAEQNPQAWVGDLLSRIGDDPKTPGDWGLRARTERSHRKQIAEQNKALAPKKIAWGAGRGVGGGTLAPVPLDMRVGASQVTGQPPTDAAQIAAIADRSKLGIRLMVAFEKWAAQPHKRPIREALELLDLPSAILDDAVADIRGEEPPGYLKDAPEILAELSKSEDFCTADLEVLRTGRVPQVLATLSKEPMVVDGSWQSRSLQDAISDPKIYGKLLTLKRWLDPDHRATLSVLVGHLLSPKIDPKVAQEAYRTLCDVAQVDIPCLDPSLSDADRLKEISKFKKPEGLLGQMLEDAVHDRFLSSDADDPKTAFLLEYIASGEPEVAQRNLVSAADQAPSDRHFEMLVERCRTLAAAQGPAHTDVMKSIRHAQMLKKQPWMISILSERNTIDIDRLKAIRETMVEARKNFRGNEQDSDGHLVKLFVHVLDDFDRYQSIGAEELRTLGMILAESDSHGSRRAKVDGLSTLFNSIEVSPERLATVREILKVTGSDQSEAEAASIYRVVLDSLRRISQVYGAIGEEELKNMGPLITLSSTGQAKRAIGEGMALYYGRVGSRFQAEKGALLKSKKKAAQKDLLAFEQDRTQFWEYVERWIQAEDQQGGLHEQERTRSEIFRILADLTVTDADTVDALANALMGRDYDERQRIVSECTKLKSRGKLTPKNIRAAVSNKSYEKKSTLGKLFGTALTSFGWNAADLVDYVDPLSASANDSLNVQRAKRKLNSAFRSAMWDLELHRREITAAPLATGSSDRFAISSWFRSQGVDELSKQEAETRRMKFDLNAENAANEANIAAWRQAKLEGKGEYELYAIGDALATDRCAVKIDNLFDKKRHGRRRRRFSTEHGQLNIHRFVQWVLMQQANAQSFEKGEQTGGVEMPPIFETYNRERSDEVDQDLSIDVINVIDNSLSTTEDPTEMPDGRIVTKFDSLKRADAFVRETNDKVNRIKIRTGTLRFGDDPPTQVLPLAQRESMQVKAHALGSLKADGSYTKDVPALHLARQIFAKSKAKIKIAIFFTDGQGQDNMPQEVQRAMEEDGILCVGVGMSQDAKNVKKNFPISLLVEDPSELERKIYTFYNEIVGELL